MGTISSVTANINKLDLAKEAMFVVVDMKQFILDLNKDQLADGINKNGTLIQPSYKLSTKKYKLALGRTGNVDLLKTGDYQEAMKLDVKSKTEYLIYSSDWKNFMLLKRYASTIPYFGLTSQSRSQLLNNGFRMQLADRVKEVTNLD